MLWKVLFLFSPSPAKANFGDHVYSHGYVELMLPKAMIADIQSISAGNQEITIQQVGSTATDTRIKFAVPEGSTGPVSIKAGAVVPEFGVIAVLTLAVSPAAMIGITRFMGQAFGFRP